MSDFTATNAMATLPPVFDPIAVDQYLDGCGVRKQNREKIMRVVLDLISGRGVAHPNKPESFLAGHRVTPYDDLEKMRTDGNEWLPYTGKDRVDKSGGYRLNHPMQKLIYYKNHLLGIESGPPKKGVHKRDNRMKMLRALKKRLDDGDITPEHYESHVADILK